jgi:hypothetical protein
VSTSSAAVGSTRERLAGQNREPVTLKGRKVNLFGLERQKALDLADPSPCHLSTI